MVVALHTDKMVYETECLARMYLAGEELADVEEVDIAHIRADFYLTNLRPQDRGLEEAGQAEDIGHKALLAYHTVRSTQRHWDRRERSVAAGAGHTGHKELRRSVAVDIEYSVAGVGSDRIDAVAGVMDAEAEATMTGTEQDMVVEVRVVDGVADGLMVEGALGNGEGVDVGVDGGRVRERDVGAEVVVRT